VLASGVQSARLAKSLGYRLPIYPVTGYSITYEHPHDFGSQPRVGAVSVPHKIAWASFGNRVRFTGYADIGIPRSEARMNARFEALERFAQSIYPSARGITPQQRWAGQRPMTPDGLPIIGSSRHGNLYFNCGHGAMGWTMACGSAQLLRDAITGQQSSIDSRAYGWSRFG
jgi:D-amino-acid dehydrogenase